MDASKGSMPWASREPSMPASTSPVPAFARAGVPSVMTWVRVPSEIKVSGPLSTTMAGNARAKSSACTAGVAAKGAESSEGGSVDSAAPAIPKASARRAASPPWGVTTVAKPASARLAKRLRAFFEPKHDSAPPSTTTGQGAFSARSTSASASSSPGTKPGPTHTAQGFPARMVGSSSAPHSPNARTTSDGDESRTTSTARSSVMTSVYPAPMRWLARAASTAAPG